MTITRTCTGLGIFAVASVAAACVGALVAAVIGALAMMLLGLFLTLGIGYPAEVVTVGITLTELSLVVMMFSGQHDVADLHVLLLTAVLAVLLSFDAVARH